MSKKQHIRWTEEMYACLAWRLFEDLYGATEWYEEEDQRIHSYAKAAREKLDVFSRKVVDNRARRLSNEYHEHILYSLEKMYWHEIHDRDDGYLQPPIEYDTHHYETWSEGVHKRRTVRMVYDSTTSGTSERLVDPYQTRTPYGDGYCHKSGEVRKFRFDRIIDITLTDQMFEKPKHWKEMVK